MNKSKLPSYVSIAIMTAITSVFWIFFGVYRIFSTQPSPKVSEEILEEVNPELDRNTISEIQGRIFFEEGQIPQTLITQTPTPTPTLQPTPQPSASPSASPTATATPSPQP